MQKKQFATFALAAASLLAPAAAMSQTANPVVIVGQAKLYAKKDTPETEAPLGYARATVTVIPSSVCYEFKGNPSLGSSVLTPQAPVCVPVGNNSFHRDLDVVIKKPTGELVHLPGFDYNGSLLTYMSLTKQYASQRPDLSPGGIVHFLETSPKLKP